MNVSLKQWRAFLAVAQTQSFAEAASLVHMSQPALSIAMKNLEAELGGQLFARSTRAVALTPEGAELLPQVQRLLADWDNVMADAHQRFSLKRGRLAIAAMPSFASTALPAVLQAFRSRFSEISITVQEVIAEQLLEQVQEGRIELGVSFDPGNQPDVAFTPLFSDHFVAVFPAGHALAQAGTGPLDWAQLCSYPFVGLQRPSSLRALIDRHLSAQALSLNVVLEANQLATVGRMVATGLGVSAVPKLCEPQMHELGLSCRALVAPDIERQVGVLTHGRRPLSKAASAMIDELKRHYAER
ncbi:LysR family transcriptional regulator [Simiduia sp. 21SJ11W-1]|uniref:LysR family transcriptional regulator n=1 Tax=Simiduia sp. 21SJ11W-1 TaxID=2909669 RepID=UPI00209E8A3C|nr:LysR family transcriptional regulator [Simiduia sp. 21SJ11W-1]UTA46667.1 LysR family transcriptional regulator [Simiduia sp. 21SJ11W-1]